MHTLFQTAPLTCQQWGICLLPMLPMVPFAALVNRVDPSQTKQRDSESTLFTREA